MNIFDDVIEQQTDHDNPATAAIAKKQVSLNEQVREMAGALYKANKDESDKEPDWSFLIRNAKSQAEKWKVMAARDAYQEDQKMRIFEEQQARFDERVNRLLSTPLAQRNKFFYEDLQRNDPNVYFDSRVQRQRQRDRETLKLAYHLKAR